MKQLLFVATKPNLILLCKYNLSSNVKIVLMNFNKRIKTCFTIKNYYKLCEIIITKKYSSIIKYTTMVFNYLFLNDSRCPLYMNPFF